MKIECEKAIGNAATLATNLIRLVSYRSFVASSSLFFRFCSLSLPRSPLYFFDIFIFLIHCWYSFSRTVTIRFRLFLRVIFPFAWMRLYFFIWLVCWHLVPQHKRLFAIILWIPLCLFSFLFVVVAAAAAGAAVVVVLALFLIILWTTTVRSSFCFSFPHLHHVIAWKFAVDFFHFFFRRTVWVHSLRKWHSERERERDWENEMQVEKSECCIWNETNCSLLTMAKLAVLRYCDSIFHFRKHFAEILHWASHIM